MTVFLGACGSEQTRPAPTGQPDVTVDTTRVEDETPAAPVTLDGYDVVDPARLSVVLNACNPIIEQLEVGETPEMVTITITATSPPATTNAQGEENVQNDCQTAVEIALEQPLGNRDVIDGSDSEIVSELGN